MGPTSSWTRATWISPASPADALAVSFGLTIDSVDTLTTDDYGFAGTKSPALSRSPESPPSGWTRPLLPTPTGDLETTSRVVARLGGSSRDGRDEQPSHATRVSKAVLHPASRASPAKIDAIAYLIS
jgi:hypothetical protein